MKRSNYQEVKNLIHNELGISKDDIQDIIKQTVREEVGKLIKSDYMDVLISNLIKSEFRNGLGNSFKDNVRGIIAKEIGSLISSKMNINVEFNDNNNEKANIIYKIDNK